MNNEARLERGKQIGQDLSDIQEKSWIFSDS